MTTYTELVQQIRDYTETDSAVLTDTICNDFIEHAEIRIFKDVDLDCYKDVQNGATAITTDGFLYQDKHQQKKHLD